MRLALCRSRTKGAKLGQKPHLLTDWTLLVEVSAMPTCSVCQGEGSRRSTDPAEVERGIEDPCYHCGTTGEVDDETARQDHLMHVVSLLATMVVNAMRRAYDSDPEGEGWAFRAAENMMTEWEYTEDAIYWQIGQIAPWMDSLTEEEQDFMLQIDDPNSWHALCFRAEQAAKAKRRLEKLSEAGIKTFTQAATECDIPF